MATISPTQSSPLTGVNGNSGREHTEVTGEIHNAKIVLANEMKRLYPDGVMNTGGGPVQFKQTSLEQIVENGTLRNANGELQSVSPEVKKAAQIILDNGGPASINPNGDPWFTEADLRSSIANNPANPIQQFEDFINKQRGDEV